LKVRCCSIMHLVPFPQDLTCYLVNCSHGLSFLSGVSAKREPVIH
jgi:hypothetical protein